jgi:hypothetical protein
MDFGFNRQSIGLFDHLVGQCEQRWWNFDAESPSQPFRLMPAQISSAPER